MTKYIARYFSFFAAASAITLSIYYFIRVLFFLQVNYSWFDRLFALLMLLAETHMIIQAAGFVIQAIKLIQPVRQPTPVKLDKRKLPKVSVLLAVKDEPEVILHQTLITLKALDYENKEIYILDGSNDPEIQKVTHKEARLFDINYFEPPLGVTIKSKAEIINLLLPKLDSKYIAVFDVDQNPLPEFLMQTVAIAESSNKIAFVQTPQFYTNFDVSPIAKGAAMQQAIFYESICEAKSSFNAMFICGTNVIIRLDILKEVGGFDANFVTEDFATSVKMHQKGYHSVYYNHARVFGMAPESLPAYLKQQARWATGTLGVFRVLLHELFTHPTSLSIGQWWEYFLSGTYYLVGLAFFLLMLGPIFYLLFNVPSYFIDSRVYVVTFIPYFFLNLFVFFTTMRRRKYSWSQVFNGILLSTISFPVLIAAAINGFFRREKKFVVTPKGKSGYLSFRELLPWTLMMVLNALAITQGILDFGSAPYAKLVNIIWCCYHFFILSQILRLNAPPIFKNKVFKIIDPINNYG